MRERKREGVYEKEERVKKSKCVCVYVRKRERDVSGYGDGPNPSKEFMKELSLSLSSRRMCNQVKNGAACSTLPNDPA